MAILKKSELIGLIRASHFGPTSLVVSISVLISLTNFSFIESLQIGVAILFGQFVVGWTNDLLDYPLDLAANRTKKPLVANSITVQALRTAVLLALPITFLLSLLGPLGVTGTALHLLGLLSATTYNVRLKSTIFSPLPYVISFGGLPWAIYLANEQNPPTALWLAFAFFATAFHFLNVLKDLDWDLSQRVLGLPQRLGRSRSIAVAIICAVVGITYAVQFLKHLS